MTKLHELTEELRHFQAMMDESDDIDEESFGAALEALNIEAESKATNLALWVLNLNADAAALKAEEERLAKRRKSLENQVKRIKDYLAYSLDKSIKGPLVSISKRKGMVSVTISDEAALPSAYRVPQPDKIDKTSIKADLKAGNDVPGAALIEGNAFVVIR